MPRPKILQPDRTYTFADYFKLKFSPADILADLGCRLQRTRLNLPQYSGELSAVADLRSRIEQTLPRVSLNSEMARREILIAPVLIELVRLTDAQLEIEYSIDAGAQLRGELDYFLSQGEHLLVTEAKNADLTRGFTQLAVELIALHRWLDLDGDRPLFGAVSTGDVWQFGRYHPAEGAIGQDLTLYRVPDDLDGLLRILVALLQGELPCGNSG